jgi:hypothetical protein
LIFEYRPEKDTPQHVLDELREYGGLSPDGQAIWRVILAQNSRVHCFGRRNHFSAGKLDKAVTPSAEFHTVDDIDRPYRASVRDMRPTDVIPDRIEEGEFWIPRYRAKGWILERWFPASVWGSKAKWESEKATDGRMRLLAAYPQRGDYLMMAGPWPQILFAGDLKAAIRSYNFQQKNNPVNWENHIQLMAHFEETERQALADAYAEEMAAQHREGLAGILRSTSGPAQEFRNVVSRHTAGSVNLGASEKWG